MGYKGLYNPYQYDLFSEENETPAPANGFQLPAEQVAGMSSPGGLQLPAEQRPGAYYTGPPSLLAQGAPGSATSVPYPTDFLNKYYGNNASQGSSNVAIGGCFGGDCFNTELDLSSPNVSSGSTPSASQPYAGSWYNPGMNPYAGGYYGVEMDPNQMINTLTGKPDEPTTGTLGENFPQGAGKEANLDLKDNVSGPGSVGNVAAEAKEKMEKNIKEIAEPFTEIPEDEECPEGQKWDPKRKQCYKETKGTFEPEANLLISGLRAVGDIIGRREQSAQDRRFADMTLADNIMAPKPGSTFKTRGLYDINTFGIPNAGVYANNYVQPAEQLPSVKKGGDVMYLTDQEILDIINMGGQVEFLD
jgi:hypothetical protein